MTITSKEIDNINIGVYKNAKSTKRSDIMRLIEFLIPTQNYIKDRVLKLREIEDEKEQKEYRTKGDQGTDTRNPYRAEGEGRRIRQTFLRSI